MNKILVLMSTYNGEKYICEQIESILKQKKCHVDVLIRDDGSTDGTLDVISSYCERYPNISVLPTKGENLKPAMSFMELIKQAGQYEYYAFADQDDIWYENKLCDAVQHLEVLSDAGVYCSNARLVDGKGASLGRLVHRNGLPTDFNSVIIGCGFLGCTMVMNDKLVKEVKNICVNDSILMHDYLVTCACAAIGGTVIYDNKATMDYRQHQNNAIGTSVTKVNALKNRITLLMKKRERSIVDTISLILQSSIKISPCNQKFLNVVVNYKKSFKDRIKLTFCRFSMGTVNMTVLRRVLIFFKRV